MTSLKFAGFFAACSIAATAALAGGHSAGPIEQAIKARKSQMTLYSFNLSILGAMAKGEREYDAEVAAMAAGDLNSAAHITMSEAWPQGSDKDSVEGTRALAEAWTTYPAIVEEGEALRAATETLASAAGESLDALRGAIGPVGKACGSCHEKYRAEN